MEIMQWIIFIIKTISFSPQVTEYASYGSLEENLQKKDKDVCRVSTLSKFADQVAQGMDYLARQNLVHRDLSARNILVFQPDLVSSAIYCSCY